MIEQPTHPIWPRDLFATEDAEVGVKIWDFARAIQTYVMMQQGRLVSIAGLIQTFNTDRQSVLDAVADGVWLYTTGADDDDTKCFVGVDGE